MEMNAFMDHHNKVSDRSPSRRDAREFKKKSGRVGVVDCPHIALEVPFDETSEIVTKDGDDANVNEAKIAQALTGETSEVDALETLVKSKAIARAIIQG